VLYAQELAQNHLSLLFTVLQKSHKISQKNPDISRVFWEIKPLILVGFLLQKYNKNRPKKAQKTVDLWT